MHRIGLKILSILLIHVRNFGYSLVSLRSWGLLSPPSTVYFPSHSHPASTANGKALSMRPPVRNSGKRTRRRTSGHNNGTPENVSASATM